MARGPLEAQKSAPRACTHGFHPPANSGPLPALKTGRIRTETWLDLGFTLPAALALERHAQTEGRRVRGAAQTAAVIYDQGLRAAAQAEGDRSSASLAPLSARWLAPG